MRDDPKLSTPSLGITRNYKEPFALTIPIFIFQLPLSGSHAADADGEVSSPHYGFQLPLSGSRRGNQARDRGICSFQLPLSGSQSDVGILRLREIQEVLSTPSLGITRKRGARG